MSAFPESGRSDTPKTAEIRGRFRPEGAVRPVAVAGGECPRFDAIGYSGCCTNMAITPIHPMYRKAMGNTNPPSSVCQSEK